MENGGVLGKERIKKENIFVVKVSNSFESFTKQFHVWSEYLGK